MENSNNFSGNKREIDETNLRETLPETLTNSIYTPAFLRKHIGRLVKVEFLIGTNYLEDRTGILLEVGASYIILRSVQDNNLLYCDIYSIKFVTISNQSFIYNPEYQDLFRLDFNGNNRLTKKSIGILIRYFIFYYINICSSSFNALSYP